MEIKFLKRNIFQRIFGIPATAKPQDPSGWHYSDGVLEIDLERTPELKEASGAVRIEGGDLPMRVLVMRDESGTLRAFHNRCTHGGHRRLDPVPGTQSVQCCSVNKSTYTFDGQKIHGPVPDPIKIFEVQLEGQKLMIRL